MKRNVYIKKGIAFLLIFSTLFYTVQNVLRYKWENHEFISTRLQCYSDEPKDTIDVLFFGSSPIYAGITPIVMWNDSGITGMNFGTSLQNALCTYYQLEYALQKQSPNIIVLDFAALFEDRKADNVLYEATYRKIAETMPDAKLRRMMISDIVRKSENQDILSYYFPLFRYHERWTEISKTDFVPVKRYKDYFKGGLLNNVKAVVKPIEEKYYDPMNANISLYAEEYYEKIINRCRRDNIIVVAVTPPVLDQDYNFSRLEKLEDFCKEKEIDYINYNSEENLALLNLDFTQDFYDSGHMNINGSIKLTRDIGRRLVDLYGLENHLDDPKYNTWNEQWALFAKEYEENLLQTDNSKK